MTTENIAAALQRAAVAFERHPAAVHDDAPASAVWQGGLRMIANHANGTQLATDMPPEFGGAGDSVSPGWLFRAGVASCAATSITMLAVSEGVVLQALTVRVSSRSDSRGLLGLSGADGTPVNAGPGAMQLKVEIAANGIAPRVVRELVARAVARSPIPNAVQAATPLALRVDVAGAAD
jgi:uncharacterized OsmC-like protein